MFILCHIPYTCCYADNVLVIYSSETTLIVTLADELIKYDVYSNWLVCREWNFFQFRWVCCLSWHSLHYDFPCVLM